ncbi:MAG TPA: radical SAM protein [bacterium]|nr:radical SAM protein [bacterium]
MTIKRPGILFEIADRCDARCLHCYQPRECGHRLMTLAEMERTLDILADNEYLDVTFSGYEPFTNPDLFKIIEAARKRRFFVNLKTNGLHLTAENVARLKALHVGTVHLSLYSADRNEHDRCAGVSGAYDRIMAGIDHLREAGIKIVLAAPLLRPLPDLARLTAFAKERDLQLVIDYGLFSSFDHRPEVETVKLTDEELEAAIRFQFSVEGDEMNFYAPKEASFLCHYGDPSTFRINCAGDIYACGKCTVPLGNILTDDFAALVRKAAAERPLIIRNRKCNDCDLFAYCNPCPAEALLDGDSLCGCSAVRKRIAELKRKMSTLGAQKTGTAAEDPCQI